MGEAASEASSVFGATPQHEGQQLHIRPLGISFSLELWFLMPKRLGTTDLKRKSLDDLLMDFYMTKKKFTF